jgi:hypothetical protein
MKRNLGMLVSRVWKRFAKRNSNGCSCRSSTINSAFYLGRIWTAIRRAQYELERLDDECERRRRQIEERRHVQVHAPALLNVALLLT